jgi:hypothetical protein
VKTLGLYPPDLGRLDLVAERAGWPVPSGRGSLANPADVRRGAVARIVIELGLRLAETSPTLLELVDAATQAHRAGDAGRIAAAESALASAVLQAAIAGAEA